MIAVDTNVFIYRLDRNDPIKQRKARALLRQLATGSDPTIVPWQVSCELVRQLRYWQDQMQLTRDDLLRYVAAFRRLFPIVMPTEWFWIERFRCRRDIAYRIGTACCWALVRKQMSIRFIQRIWGRLASLTASN